MQHQLTHDDTKPVITILTAVDIVEAQDDAKLTAVAGAYSQLLKQLQPDHQVVTAGKLKELAFRPDELILFAFTNDVLVATAQVTRFFPGGVPTGLVNNVVVDVSCRGQNLGTTMMVELEQRIFIQWVSDIEQTLDTLDTSRLKLVLTSSHERGTDSFYQRLGFTAKETVRYSKWL